MDVVKFRAIRSDVLAPTLEDTAAIGIARTKMHDAGLLGVYKKGVGLGIYAEGVGFGNISVKNDRGDILISGTQTGGPRVLGVDEYSTVSRVSVNENTAWYNGAKPSSETLAHHMVYEADPNIGAVCHAHSKEMWLAFLNTLPTTHQHADYGTTDLANEIARLFQETDVRETGILLTAGHPEGIFSFGRTVDEALEIMLRYQKMASGK